LTGSLCKQVDIHWKYIKPTRI